MRIEAATRGITPPRPSPFSLPGLAGSLLVLGLLAGCGGGGSADLLADGPPDPPPTVSPTWAAQAGGEGSTWGAKVDGAADGASLTVGGFDGEAVFGAGEERETALSSASAGDAYVARYAEDGTLDWVRPVTGDDYTVVQDVSASSDGGAAVAGYYFGTLVAGAEAPEEDPLVTTGWEDAFVARYGADGETLWVRAITDPWGVEALGVGTRSDGSIVVSGLFFSDAVFGAGEANETTLSVQGYLDAFLACYDADGSLRWARQIPATADGIVTGWSLAVTPDDGVVVAGDLEGGAVFGPGEANETTLHSVDGSTDAYVARYDAEGRLLWARSAGGPETDSVYAVGCDAEGRVRLAGTFAGTLTFDAGGPNELPVLSGGSTDAYVAAWDADGAFQWVVQAAGTGADSAQDVQVCTDGSVVWIGCFAGFTVIAPFTPDQLVLSSAGTGDCEVFLCRLQPDGTPAWAHRLGGASDDHGAGVSTFACGDVVATGCFAGTATYGEDEVEPAPGGVDLIGQGDLDAFLLRLHADGTP
jgi:hypothetical protein